jgi:hypothetical protein
VEDIIIKIAGDSKEFVASLAEVGESSENLSGKLGALGAAAAAAFAGFSASIMGAVYAFRQQEQASIQVNAIITATGGIAGVTAEKVNELAESLSKETTYSRTAVTEAEAMLLTFTRVGSEVFPQATEATADLAAGMHIGLTEAAAVVGRALQSPENAARALRAAHIQLTASQQAQIKSMIQQGDTAGAQKVILDELEGRYGGLSKAAAQGTGVFLQVKNVMEDLTQAIGAELAPALITGATWLRDLIKAASENESLVKFIAEGLALAAAFTGVVAAVAGAVTAMKLLAPAFEAATVAAEAFGVSLSVATMGIGFLIIAAAEIYQHWNVVWPAAKALFQAFVQAVASLASGLGKILMGAMELDLDKIKEGWAQVKLAVSQGVHAVGEVITTANAQRHVAVVNQDDAAHAAKMAKNRAYQEQILADDRAHQAALERAQSAANQALLLEEQHHSTLLVGLKKQEAADLKILADEEFRGNKAAVQAHLKEVEKLYAEAKSTEAQRLGLADTIMRQEIGVHNAAIVAAEKAKISLLEKMADIHYQHDKAALQAELQQQDLLIAREQQRELQSRQKFNAQVEKITKQFHLKDSAEHQAYLQKHEQQLLSQMQTEQTAEDVFLERQMQIEIQAHNQRLQDQIQFGATYAQLNQAMHTVIYQGSKTAFGELENLTQSHNGALKEIGKRAAEANIIMKTWESAMNIFAGFSTIPIVGYALGIAGAAAAVAFGMEQLSQVEGMAQGGLVTGGVPGRDSVPAMLMPGELVVPTQNFDQVVSSYKNSQGGQGGQQNNQPQKVQVQIDLHPNASRMLQVKNIKDSAMGTFRGNK